MSRKCANCGNSIPNSSHSELSIHNFNACVESGDHLKSCDSDGYCNNCGFQEDTACPQCGAPIFSREDDKEYTVCVTRQVTESTWVTLKTSSPEEAERLAIAKAKTLNEDDWQPDDDNVPPDEAYTANVEDFD